MLKKKRVTKREIVEKHTRNRRVHQRVIKHEEKATSKTVVATDTDTISKGSMTKINEPVPEKKKRVPRKPVTPEPEDTITPKSELKQIDNNEENQ